MYNKHRLEVQPIETHSAIQEQARLGPWTPILNAEYDIKRGWIELFQSIKSAG